MYIHTYIHIYIYRERERYHQLFNVWIPFGDHPLNLERNREDFAWPLRKDDTHKSRSVNTLYSTYHQLLDDAK